MHIIHEDGRHYIRKDGDSAKMFAILVERFVSIYRVVEIMSNNQSGHVIMKYAVNDERTKPTDRLSELDELQPSSEQ